MKIRLVSDIHTEFHRDGGKGWVASQNPAGIDVLVIAGDLGTLKIVPNVLYALCKVYPQVVYVNGNHELYGASFGECATKRRELNESLHNLHWLHNSATEIAGQRFIGTTMWFRDDPMNVLYRHEMNDFRVIRGFTQQVYTENKEAVRYLQANIRSGDVVVTHHLPSDRSVEKRYVGSDLNRFYVCHMDATIMAQKPALWCHGHSHASSNYRIGTTRVVSNPFGYVGHDLNPDFDESLVLSVS